MLMNAAAALQITASEALQEGEEPGRRAPALPGFLLQAGPVPKSLQYVALHLEVGRDVPACGRDRCVSQVIPNDGQVDPSLQ
jgi:hypothetical protein